MSKIILDIDSAGDDILAVIFGALDDTLNLEAVTTVCGASGDIEQATWVALNTVALTGKEIPVYQGESKPYNNASSNEQGDPVNFHETLYWKLGDRLNRFNEKQTKPMNDKEALGAVDYIIKTIHENPHDVVLVTTGPVTNIARAIEKDPSIVPLIKEAFVLGGNFKVAGNITPLSEYNIWADAEAAKIVLNANIKTTLVPLDICESNDFAASMLTRDVLYDLETYGPKTELKQYICDKFPVYIDIWREFFQLGGFPMDDVITLALVSHPELCEYTDWVHVDVETEGKLARGATVAFFGEQIMADPKKQQKNVRIAKTIDGKKFINLFTDVIIKASV